MTPTAVLDDSTTTQPTMNIASHNNQSILARSNDPHGFGVYQLTTLGASNATIHTLIPVLISALPPPILSIPLRRAPFPPQILRHAASPSISISDLVTTVGTFLDMEIAIAERDTETVADFICNSIFRVTIMIGVGFINSKGKSITIDDPSRRQDDITYFTFRAIINLHFVNKRAIDSVH